MRGSSPVDTRATEKALVGTYTHPSYVDLWEVVLDYRQVRRAMNEHPSKPAPFERTSYHERVRRARRIPASFGAG